MSCSDENARPMCDFACEQELGELLGKGGSRLVYAVKGDPSVVLKQMKSIYPGTNMIEWLVWCWIKDEEIASQFARCINISETGRYLKMERLNILEVCDKLPKMPEWVTDPKPENFGRTTQGETKMLDYALVQMGPTLGGKREDFSMLPPGWMPQD